jgi:hypothetical protein
VLPSMEDCSISFDLKSKACLSLCCVLWHFPVAAGYSDVRLQGTYKLITSLKNDHISVDVLNDFRVKCVTVSSKHAILCLL